MRLVYQPEGSPEPQRWEISLGKFRSLEVEQIERLTGMDYGNEFKARLMKGNALARRALLFILLRRQHPTTKFMDVDFADDELQLEMDLEELRETRKVVETSPAITEQERPMVLAALDQQIAEEGDRAEQAGAEGKALTPTDETATG